MASLTLHPNYRQQILDEIYDRYKKTGIITTETEKEYKALVDNELLMIIMPELNVISEEFIRNKDTFRREEDVNELAITASLVLFKLKIFLESKGIELEVQI